jgi:hypothetical protein
MTAIMRRDYSHEEVAAIFGVPVETIRRRAINRQIPHVRIDEKGTVRIRYSEDDVREIDRMFRVTPEPQPVMLDRQKRTRPTQRPNLAAVPNPPRGRRHQA